MLVRRVKVGDPLGLHARVVYRLTEAASQFSASIWVRYGDRRASLTDPIHMLALGAVEGAELTVMADGLDEEQALEDVCALIADTAP